MRELTYDEAALEAIAEEMRRDPKIFYMSTDAIGAAAARSSATPRIKATPITEAALYRHRRSARPAAASARSSIGGR